MRRLAVFAAIVLATACGDGNSLEGSISDSFSLDFDRVRIRKQAPELLIEYLKKHDGGTDKVCKVVVNTEGMSLGGNTNIRGPTFLDRVTVTRVAATGGDFPDVDSGSMHFDTYEFRDGGDMKGRFDVLFVNGRTLNGDFEGKVDTVPTD